VRGVVAAAAAACADEEQLCERMQKLEAEAAKIAQKHADTQRELARKMRLRKETYESKMGEIYRKKFWTSGEAVRAQSLTAPASMSSRQSALWRFAFCFRRSRWLTNACYKVLAEKPLHVRLPAKGTID